MDIKTFVSSFHVKESLFILLLIIQFFMVNLFEEFYASEKKPLFLRTLVMERILLILSIKKFLSRLNWIIWQKQSHWNEKEHFVESQDG